MERLCYTDFRKVLSSVYRESINDVIKYGGGYDKDTSA